ncbi:hypothetical protein B0H14DRAFT_3133074 [Mycena olivaceomarginata]|nr:hypothetical protein B0H14DRAFT_3133074 [Mycena olivaceomarginata]
MRGSRWRRRNAVGGPIVGGLGGGRHVRAVFHVPISSAFAIEPARTGNISWDADAGGEAAVRSTAAATALIEGGCPPRGCGPLRDLYVTLAVLPEVQQIGCRAEDVVRVEPNKSDSDTPGCFRSIITQLASFHNFVNTPPSNHGHFSATQRLNLQSSSKSQFLTVRPQRFNIWVRCLRRPRIYFKHETSSCIATSQDIYGRARAFYKILFHPPPADAQCGRQLTITESGPAHPSTAVPHSGPAAPNYLSVSGPERNPSPHTTFPWFIGHNEYFGMNPIIQSAVLLWGTDL